MDSSNVDIIVSVGVSTILGGRLAPYSVVVLDELDFQERLDRLEREKVHRDEFIVHIGPNRQLGSFSGGGKSNAQKAREKFHPFKAKPARK